MKMMDKRKLKRLVAEDMKNALTALGEYLQDDQLGFNEYIILWSRFKELRRQDELGLISGDNLMVEENRIRASMVALIDRVGMPDDELRSDGASGTPINSFFGALSTEEYFPLDQRWSPPKDLRAYRWKDHHPFFLETFDLGNEQNKTFKSYEDEKWIGRLEDGLFRLSNTVDPYAVKYHYLNINDQEMSVFPLSVEIKIQAENSYPKPGGGLVFCFELSTRRYYAFHINNEKEFSLWRKDEKAYNIVYSGRSNAIQVNEFNKLGVIKDQNTIYMFINDEYVKSVKDNVLQGGDSGLMALGKGNFFFDNLSFYEK